MTKKMLALLCALILLASTMVPILAHAYSMEDVKNIDVGEVVSAFRQDLDNARVAGGMLKNAAHGLRESMVPYVQNVVLTEENMDKLLSLASTLMAKVIAKLQNPDTPVQPTEPTEPTEPSEPTEPTEPTQPTDPTAPTQPTAPTKPTTTESRLEQAQKKIRELVDFLKRNFYVELDNPGEVAQYIADDSGIEYDVIEGEGGTYYLHIDIENNRQMFNYAVFRDLVDDLVAKQNAEMLKDPNGNYDYVMTYEHIAGELAFHMLVWAGAKGIMKVTNSQSEQLLKIYESASQADLNANESRLPSEVFAIVGLILYNFFFFNTLRALGIIKA